MELPYLGFSVPKSFGMCVKQLVSLREITCGNIRIIWTMEILSKQKYENSCEINEYQKFKTDFASFKINGNQALFHLSNFICFNCIL